MRRISPWIVVSIACFVSPVNAQEFCGDVRNILAAAPTEFTSLIGASLPEASRAHLAVFEGTQPLAGAGTCAVAQQTINRSRLSTSYTCANAGSDDDAGLRSLLTRLQECLDVTAWREQRQADSRGPLVAQYGLIRLSVTRNGERGGLALGVEVFRDENGEVMGSPTRGHGDGRRCQAKSPEEITAFVERYASIPGAERVVGPEGVTISNQTTGVFAVATRPTHPAHPALIVQSIRRRDGAVYVDTEGDFAGDCTAFGELMAQAVARFRR